MSSEQRGRKTSGFSKENLLETFKDREGFGGAVLIEGHLRKKASGPISRWQERYFTVQGGGTGTFLKYYSERPEGMSAYLETNLKGTLDLSEMETCEATVDACSFKIGLKEGKGETLLKSTTQDDADRWIKLLSSMLPGLDGAEEAQDANTLSGLNIVKLDNLVMMDSITEAEVVSVLKARFLAEEIYTNIGSVLVALNPYKLVHKDGVPLYDPSFAKQYVEADEMRPPHIFKVAASAVREMLQNKESQCVIVSGDSGAGKTEACKQIMHYIALMEDGILAVRKANTRNDPPSKSRRVSLTLGAGGRKSVSDKTNKRISVITHNTNLDSNSTMRSRAHTDHQKHHQGTIDVSTMSEHSRYGLMGQMLESSLMLESVGNAQTVHNNNSSRFGKYMEILFDFNGMVLGGTITQYLLEKIRVVRQGDGERNYHCFYQLLAGANSGTASSASAEQFEKLNWPKVLDGKGPADFVYLANESRTVPGVDDAADFEDLVQSMQTALNFKDEQCHEVFAALCGALFLGNINFIGDEAATVDESDAASNDALSRCANLLGVSEARLKTAMVERTVKAIGRSSVSRAVMNATQAKEMAGTLAKAIYARLFSELINASNQLSEQDASGSVHKSGGGDKELSLGLLDIYGFEVFDGNSLDQLYINYVNEKLQQLFIELVLKTQQEEYKEEGIDWVHVEFFNNKVVCDLIENRSGLLGVLDEQCAYNESTPERLIFNFNKLKTNVHYIPAKRLESTTSFSIKHYAGVVQYDVTDFIEKNRDTFWNDLLLLMQTSENPLLAKLFEDNRSDADKRKRPPTTSMQFKKQVSALVTSLSSCRQHYVRCIKPNEQKKQGLVEDAVVQRQVIFGGITEQVKVAQSGFANRFTFKYFCWRYKMLNDQTWPLLPAGMSQKDATAHILSSPPFGLKAGEDFVLGKTKVFLKKGTVVQKLEEVRMIKLPPLVIPIQAIARMYVCRRDFKKGKSGATKMQAELRRKIQHRAFKAQKKGAIAIQFRMRGWIARCRWLVLKRQIECSRLINRCCRGYMSRKALPEGWLAKIQNAGEVVRQRKREAATKIQSEARRRQAQKHFAVQKKGAIRMAACVRCIIRLRDFKRMRACATKLQQSYRCHQALFEYKRKRQVTMQFQIRLRIVVARNVLRRKKRRHYIKFQGEMVEGVQLTKQFCLPDQTSESKKLWISEDNTRICTSWKGGKREYDPERKVASLHKASAGNDKHPKASSTGSTADKSKCFCLEGGGGEGEGGAWVLCFEAESEAQRDFLVMGFRTLVERTAAAKA
jgi:myosin-1